jgi:hypothetical protein
MESSTRLMEASARRDPGTVRLTRIGLLVAAAGALLMVFDLFGGAKVGLVMAVVGTLLAARGGIGARWYTALAIAAVLAVVGRLVAQGAHTTLGGWLAVIATLLILIAVSLGYPVASDESE